MKTSQQNKVYVRKWEDKDIGIEPVVYTSLERALIPKLSDIGIKCTIYEFEFRSSAESFILTQHKSFIVK